MLPRAAHHTGQHQDRPELMKPLLAGKNGEDQPIPRAEALRALTLLRPARHVA